MPNFNLRIHKQAQYKAIDRLNVHVKPEERIRPSDVEDLTPEDIENLDAKLKKKVRVARHGTNDMWFPVDSNYSPYKTSPLVNAKPEFGGRWNTNFPGSGDNHINDNSDGQKAWKGHQDGIGQPDGPGSGLPASVIGPRYVVRMRINLGENPEKVKKSMESVSGRNVGQDGGSVFIEVESYEEALRMQKRLPKAVVEPRS